MAEKTIQTKISQTFQDHVDISILLLYVFVDFYDGLYSFNYYDNLVRVYYDTSCV